jgi:hypothetical protein
MEWMYRTGNIQYRCIFSKCCGSGSGAFLTPGFWIRDQGLVKNQDPGMNIPDHISESLETIFWAKILKFFDANPDTGIFLTLDPGRKKFGSGIRDEHLRSARRFFPVRPDKLSQGSESSERGFILQVKGETQRFLVNFVLPPFYESKQNFASV